MTQFLTRLCLAIFLCFGAVLVTAQDADQPSGTISINGDADSDAAIAIRIREILSELDGFEDVTVAVRSGIVTLHGTALDQPTVARLNDIVGRVEGVVAIENEVAETTDVVRRLNPAMERFAARMAQIVAFLPLFAVSLAAFAVVMVVGWLIAGMRNPWDRLTPNAFIADLLRTVIRLAFGVGGLVMALDILGATALLSTILGAAGIIGLAIGFAVRDTVENFIASVLLSVRQPFRPNDAIEINGDEGKVIRLTSRATILLSWDGNHIRIPNATVYKSRIVNYSRNRERRFSFSLGLAPDSDFVRAIQIAHQTLADLPYVLDTPGVDVWINAVGESTIDLQLVGWIDQNATSLLAARGEAIRQCIAALSQAGIAMPEPTYRLITSRGEPPVQQPRPRTPPVVVAEPGETMTVEATAELQLEAIVEEERREKHDNDLLTTDAPEE